VMRWDSALPHRPEGDPFAPADGPPVWPPAAPGS